MARERVYFIKGITSQKRLKIPLVFRSDIHGKMIGSKTQWYGMTDWKKDLVPWDSDEDNLTYCDPVSTQALSGKPKIEGKMLIHILYPCAWSMFSAVGSFPNQVDSFVRFLNTDGNTADSHCETLRQ